MNNIVKMSYVKRLNQDIRLFLLEKSDSLVQEVLISIVWLALVKPP